jgi:putative flippase GtrA
VRTDARAPAGEPGRIVRFALSGAFNTAVTYALYVLALRLWLPHVAYTVVYVAGIALAYVLNRVFVFRSHAGWRSVAATPVVYLFQYLLSLGIVQLWVSVGLPASLAPIPAIVLSLPVTYVLSRLSFSQRSPDA